MADTNGQPWTGTAEDLHLQLLRRGIHPLRVAQAENDSGDYYLALNNKALGITTTCELVLIDLGFAKIDRLADGILVARNLIPTPRPRTGLFSRGRNRNGKEQRG